jgi:hypothetical protein
MAVAVGREPGGVPHPQQAESADPDLVVGTPANPRVPQHLDAARPRPPIRADAPGMNDFHIALLWLRSLEIVIGHSPVIMLSEIDMHDLFSRYRSPYKA